MFQVVLACRTIGSKALQGIPIVCQTTILLLISKALRDTEGDKLRQQEPWLLGQQLPKSPIPRMRRVALGLPQEVGKVSMLRTAQYSMYQDGYVSIACTKIDMIAKDKDR